MPLFKKKPSDEWHQQVEGIAAQISPLTRDLQPNSAFPWHQMRMITENYLRKKKITTELERDSRLMTLLQRHSLKEVAVAACGEAMSSRVLKEIIQTHLNVDPESTDGPTTFLKCIIVAGHVKPDCMSALEVRWARLLATFSRPVPPAPGPYLQNALDCLRLGTQDDIFLYPHITASVQAACRNFANDLEALRVQSQLARAQQAVGWLSTCTNGSFGSLAPEVNSAFPAWTTWAAWRPNISRLNLWESIASEQRDALRDIIALEGPDFEGRIYPRLLEGLCAKSSFPRRTIRRGKLCLKMKSESGEEARGLLDRLLKAVDAGCAAGSSTLKLLAYICVDKPISDEDFRFLETVASSSDRSLSGLILQLFTASERAEGAPVDKVTPLLPVMDSMQILREVLGPYVVRSMSYHLQNMQVDLREHLQANAQWDIIVNNLRKFGKALRQYQWLPSLLNCPSHLLDDSWPSHKEVKYLQTLRKAAKSLKPAAAVLLTQKIDAYCLGRLVTPGAADEPTRQLVERLLVFWQQVADTNRRAIALMVVQDLDTKPILYYRCLEQIPNLPNEIVQRLVLILRCCTEDVKTGSVKLARLLASTIRLNSEVAMCWRVNLRRMIEQNRSTFENYISMEVTIETWFQWLEDVGLIFADLMDSPPLFRPGFLRPALHRWTQGIAPYVSVIKYLGESTNSQAAVQCILSASEEPLSTTILAILETLQDSQGKHYLPCMQTILCWLHADGGNLWDIERPISRVAATSPPGVDACLRLIELYHVGRPKLVAEVVLDSYRFDSALTRGDVGALEALAETLGLELEAHRNPSADALYEAAEYIETELSLLLAEARRLENLRISCKASDPHGTSAMLAESNIEDSSFLDDAISDLPTTFVDVIEKVSEREVEMTFPLTHFTTIQRIAMGIGSAQNMLVHLIVTNDGLPPGFCLHMDDEFTNSTNGVLEDWTSLAEEQAGMDSDYNDSFDEDSDMPDVPEVYIPFRAREVRPRLQTGQRSRTNLSDRFRRSHDFMDFHSPWFALLDTTESTTNLTCHGPSNHVKLQIARALSQHLLSGFESLEAVYEVVLKALNNVSGSCIICGITSTIRIIRPIPCQSPPCTRTFAKADINIRLVDIRQDPAVVDLLLTALHAVASSNQLHLLLPGCPIGTGAEITKIIGKLPKISTLQTAGDLSARLLRCHTSAETLLTWVCHSYRGFLVSATGQLRIPSMPNVHQFVFANTAPELEAAFTARVGPQATRVLFHGTSLERLHVILGQGLKNCSGTSLMAHGNSHGNGIYMAEEPSTAWGYSVAATGSGWSNSTLGGTRVIFGCEVMASSQATYPGIHVIADSSTVMIRYVFMLTATAAAPLAAHITPAMQSVFASIRAGTI